MKFRHAALLFLLAAGRAEANGPEIGIDAGMIVPLASSTVRLESEVVDVYAPIDSDEGRLECYYHLRNPSRHAVRILMGFLVASPSLEPERFPSHWDDPSLDLQVRRADVSPVPVTRRPTKKNAWSRYAPAIPDSLPTWSVDIPAESTIALSISSRITWSGGGDGDERTKVLRYLATSARLWQGPIRRARIEFHLGRPSGQLLRHAVGKSDGARVTIRPEGYRWTAEGVRWDFENWEPQIDPSLTIDWTED